MPSCPIIDTHLHLWDPALIRYPWLESNALLNRRYIIDDYRAAIGELPVEAMVFVQCEADPSEFEAEASWVSEVSKHETRIKGLVAWAPLEKGSAVRSDLEKLKQLEILRGIRRIIQFESDMTFCLRRDFIEGVRTLREFDLSFDICIDHRHMQNILKFAELIPDVPMVLDHIGKPDIKHGMFHPWAEQMRELAQFPHVTCKISGVATEADHSRWTSTEFKRFVDVAIDAFGFDRIMFGGDWPVALQAIEYKTWVQILDEIIGTASAADQRNFWRDNAARFYRI
jgi:L-fuconolactonase